VGLMSRLEDRWERRSQSALEGVEVDVGVWEDIHATPEQVWQFVTSPQSEVLVGRSCVRAFHVPGTPEGVGGWVCSLARLDSGEIVGVVEEIIESREGEFYAIRTLTAKTPVFFGVRVEPLEGPFTRVHMMVKTRVEDGMQPRATRTFNEKLSERAMRTKDIIEAHGQERATPPDSA
jgi:hypothetical protein